jgi:hypothetical protein
MKNETNEVSADVDDAVYEDWEFDYTSNIVDEFLEDDVLPKLQSFDFDNRDENYVQGMASFTLFTRLIEILVDSGWEIEDLKKAVDDFALPLTETLH